MAASKEVDIRPQGRVVVTYEIPARLQKTARGITVTSIGIAELTPLDEIEAAKRSRGDTTRLAFELAMQSFAEVNGRPVSAGDGGVETAWTQVGPKIRNLVMTAYSELNQAGGSDVQDFLGSRKG
mgnify:CR=1 FL=1